MARRILNTTISDDDCLTPVVYLPSCSYNHQQPKNKKSKYHNRERDLLRELREIDSYSSEKTVSQASGKRKSHFGSEEGSKSVSEFFPHPNRSSFASGRFVHRGNTPISFEEASVVQITLDEEPSFMEQLDVEKQPVVGLDYLIEYIGPCSSDRVYECTLCKTHHTVNSIMEHLIGYNHRVNYIVRHVPSEGQIFLLPDGSRKNQSEILTAMASQRCCELELIYGRGEYKTKNGKPKIPEGAFEVSQSSSLSENERTLQVLKSFAQVSQELRIESGEALKMVEQINCYLKTAICEYKLKEKDKK